MADRVNRLAHKTRRLVIGAESLRDFARLENPRPLREAQVSHLVRELRADKHLISAITVNDVGRGGNTRMRVIDGNHRLEAMRLLIRDDPALKFEVEFHVHDHLTEAEELALFTDINTAVRVTPNDVLTVRQAEVPIVAMLQNDFPVNMVLVSGPIKEGFRMIPFLRAYLSRLSPSLHARIKRSGNRGLIEELKPLGAKDLSKMREFAEAFVATFGVPGTHNPFSKETGLAALYKVYAMNIEAETLTREEVVARWKEKVATDPQVLSTLSNSGIYAVKFAAETIVAVMNRGYGRRMAITPADYQLAKQAKKE